MIQDQKGKSICRIPVSIYSIMLCFGLDEVAEK